MRTYRVDSSSDHRHSEFRLFQTNCRPICHCWKSDLYEVTWRRIAWAERQGERDQLHDKHPNADKHCLILMRCIVYDVAGRTTYTVYPMILCDHVYLWLNCMRYVYTPFPAHRTDKAQRQRSVARIRLALAAWTRVNVLAKSLTSILPIIWR